MYSVSIEQKCKAGIYNSQKRAETTEKIINCMGNTEYFDNVYYAYCSSGAFCINVEEHKVVVVSNNTDAQSIPFEDIASVKVNKSSGSNRLGSSSYYTRNGVTTGSSQSSSCQRADILEIVIYTKNIARPSVSIDMLGDYSVKKVGSEYKELQRSVDNIVSTIKTIINSNKTS